MGEIVPNQLFVAGYSRSKISDEKGIKEIFRKYGTIKDVAYKGSYSFVTFSSDAEAQDAIKQLNGQTVNGQKLKVDVVDNRKGRRNGPQEGDECFKCGKGGHWARDCPNRSPTRKRRFSDQRQRHHRSRRSNSRSPSYSSYSSSRSRRRRHSKKSSRYNRRSRGRSPRKDNYRKKSTSNKRSQSNSRSSPSINKGQSSSSK